MTANVAEEAEIGNRTPEEAQPETGAGPDAQPEVRPDVKPHVPPQIHASPEPAPTAEPAPEGPEPKAEADTRPSPEPEPDAERGKAKKGRKAVRGKGSGGTKTLVVWREGKVLYADDGVLVVDLDEAAAPDMDVHDVVDRLTELREALESPGRADAVAALAEIIQDKALG
jgi:hypothetical protein